MSFISALLGSLVLERIFQRTQKHGGWQNPQGKDELISCPPVIT